MLSQQINKKRSNIHQKTTLKSRPQLESILEPTWLHFGRVLGAKLGPSWHQIAPKNDPKNNQKTDHILYRFLDDFCSILDPTWTPTWGNQRLLCWFMLALGAILEPRWHLDRPRIPPGGPQDRFWTDFGMI